MDDLFFPSWRRTPLRTRRLLLLRAWFSVVGVVPFGVRVGPAKVIIVKHCRAELWVNGWLLDLRALNLLFLLPSRFSPFSLLHFDEHLPFLPGTLDFTVPVIHHHLLLRFQSLQNIPLLFGLVPGHVLDLAFEFQILLLVNLHLKHPQLLQNHFVCILAASRDSTTRVSLLLLLSAGIAVVVDPVDWRLDFNLHQRPRLLLPPLFNKIDPARMPPVERSVASRELGFWYEAVVDLPFVLQKRTSVSNIDIKPLVSTHNHFANVAFFHS